MKAAILCPGPSLVRFAGRDGYEAVVGVNRAATLLACDWWACADHPLISKVHAEVVGTPHLWTTLVAKEHLANVGTAWRGETTTFDTAYGEFPREWQWELFSATSAAVLAATLGAKQIDVWGSDLVGTADWDGVEAGKNRSDERWRCEAGIWHRLTVVLGERGIRIERK